MVFNGWHTGAFDACHAMAVDCSTVWPETTGWRHWCGGLYVRFTATTQLHWLLPTALASRLYPAQSKGNCCVVGLLADAGYRLAVNRAYAHHVKKVDCCHDRRNCEIQPDGCLTTSSSNDHLIGPCTSTDAVISITTLVEARRGMLS